MAILSDVWYMETTVMEFYDSLIVQAIKSKDGKRLVLQGVALQVVISYRTIQVELINSLASNRKINIGELAGLDDSTPLSEKETRVLMLMKGIHQKHRETIRLAIYEAKAQAPKFAHGGLVGSEQKKYFEPWELILKEAGISSGTAEGNEDGR